MKFYRLALFGMMLFFICTSQTRAQQISDSATYLASVARIHQIYLHEIGDNAQIYHGTEYIRNGMKAGGFPYYESDSMVAGSVSYQGTIYPDMNLFYNMVSDAIVCNNYLQNALISLASEKVDSFTIGTHVFIRLTADKSNGLIKEGFYEQMYSGEPAFYIRREKRLDLGTGTVEPKYIQFNYYFIEIKNVYYAVDSKKSLLELLKDEQDVLKKYIRTHKLNFKKHLESSLVLTTIYYSKLRH
jgi:hypothetical protein